ncbi:gpW family head-tail joining protein [Brevundimonas sp. DWR2-3-1b1]|uniref:gpW family head-tail joining protein n=1 Tax=unclassified Brevundimonas TaxID=2622653 RepID=UPI003CE73C8E
MALSIEEQAELGRLRIVRMRLISGENVAKITSNGRSVEYSQASLPKLEEIISGLERRAGRRRGGAIGFRL